ncbi:AsmA family protein, partial [bacterium]|nr:AsmA family protein [bacterium]
MKKFLLILTVAIAVIAIALTVFIKIYVTPETVKAFVIPLAENALNRKVSVGDLEIGLIKGININDFVIKDIENKGDFARFKNLVLKFQLAPLLSKKIIIDELKLVSPEIHIVRNKDGSYNFDDIGKKTSGTPSGKTEVTESADAPLSLLISRIAVKSANFTLKDHMGELPEFKSLTDINLKMQSLSPDEVSASGEI